MFHQEFLELVWEDGRLAMRGFPKRTQNNPSSHASNIVHEQNLGPIVSLKKPRFATADSISKNHHHDKEKDLNLNFTRNSSHQDNKDHHESLSELYQTHFDLFRGNSNHDKLPKDSQVVPVNGCADLKTRRESNYFGEIPQVAAPSNISQPADSSLQHYQTSAPSKRPRVISRPNLVSLAELANSKLKEHDIEPEGQKETLNFSLFPTSLALPTSSRRFSGAEDLKNNAKTTSGPASNNPFELMLIAPVNGSKGVKGLENRPSPRGTNVEFLTPVANPPDKSLPDAQSEAVPPRDAFTNKISQDQVYDLASRLPENYAVKGKVNNEKSIEPPAASSSFCSRGASNNPTCPFKKRYEEAELSAHRSDENEEEEEERATKTVSARRRKVKRRRLSAEVHNLYERKRRDRINKKMRALQELIPNCNMTDKASLLDEAIEYVKILQFRVQMMSMGNGMCLPPPMMIPPGMQAVRAPQITHFSPMSMGMDMRIPMVAGCNLSQFLIAPIPGATSVPGIAETRFQMPDFPNQPLPMSMLRAPFIGLMDKTLPIPGVSRVAASTERIASASKSNSRDSFHKNVGDNNYKR